MATKTVPQTMRAWQQMEFGGVEKIKLDTSAPVPQITCPTQVLVKVHAGSVNPIDTRRMEGYGPALWKRLNKGNPLFPLTLGRDFSGTVVEAGAEAGFSPGDQVFGVYPAHLSHGCNAEYVVTEHSQMLEKPASLSHTEAASLPYVAMTVWAALAKGGITEATANSKRVLINGGSGGTGTYTIQLLKAWGCNVTTTCATDAVDMLRSLGADCIIDYKTQDIPQELDKLETFDLIFECIADNFDYWKKYLRGTYVTIVSPLMTNIDSNGLILGAAISASYFAYYNLKALWNGFTAYKWGFFAVNKDCLVTTKKLVEEKKLRPVIDTVYPFDDLPAAYTRQLAGHLRGKIIIDVLATKT